MIINFGYLLLIFIYLVDSLTLNFSIFAYFHISEKQDCNSAGQACLWNGNFCEEEACIYINDVINLLASQHQEDPFWLQEKCQNFTTCSLILETSNNFFSESNIYCSVQNGFNCGLIEQLLLFRMRIIEFRFIMLTILQQTFVHFLDAIKRIYICALIPCQCQKGTQQQVHIYNYLFLFLIYAITIQNQFSCQWNQLLAFEKILTNPKLIQTSYLKILMEHLVFQIKIQAKKVAIVKKK